MKIPYIKIIQKNEIFYLTKFKFSLLKDKLNFHFREPYSDINIAPEKFDEYLENIKKKGFEITADPEGIQRRLQVSKINKIKKYLEEETDSYFPTAVVLSADVSDDEKFMENYLSIEENDYGLIELSDDIMFQIVDGQHRLAGLFSSDEEIQEDFDIPAVILFNATKHTCAKIFSDINSNQSTVNKSVIYDLYGVMDNSDDESKIIKKIHVICKKMNTASESPLYRHLKMLGIGRGAISQAFFVQSVKSAIKILGWENESQQFIYNALFLYLKAFQRVFPKYWPVLENNKYDSVREFMNFSDKILKVDKSQILKTNGFGAIMLLFPYVIEKIGRDNCESFSSYLEIIEKLEGINWINDDVISQGTGKKIQKNMMLKMQKIISNT